VQPPEATDSSSSEVFQQSSKVSFNTKQYTPNVEKCTKGQTTQTSQSNQAVISHPTYTNGGEFGRLLDVCA